MLPGKMERLENWWMRSEFTGENEAFISPATGQEDLT
jgi:hypothetical protein